MRLLLLRLGIIKTKSGVEEKKEKFASLCKKKGKGKAFCWIANYINMTNDFLFVKRMKRKNKMTRYGVNLGLPSQVNLMSTNESQRASKALHCLGTIDLRERVKLSNKSLADLKSFAFS